MPRFNGTGPRGVGPMTGRGEGYCALEISESGSPSRGYAGLRGTPMRWGVPDSWPTKAHARPCRSLCLGLYQATGLCRGSRLM